jgi:leader peptidase (prepilin peptidase) / N-methyltransferase
MMIIELIILFFVFVIGLSVGSFVNVLEGRLYAGENIFNDRSKCDHCGKVLKWFDLVPILSWIYYGGKSRCCGRKLSVQYPIVEFATGVGFVVILNFVIPAQAGILNYYLKIPAFAGMTSDIVGFGINMWIEWIFYIFIFVLFLAIFLQDLKYQAIHGGLFKVLIFVIVIFNLFVFIFDHNFQFSISNFQLNSKFEILNSNFFQNLVVAFVSALPFFVVYKISNETWLGEGDVWLVFAMGLLLGFPGVFWALYFGLIIGGLTSILILFLHLKKMRDTISLGPFLILGTLISLLWHP